MRLQRPVYAWYALYIKPNQEKKVYRTLQEKNIESYLPLVKKLRQWSDRKKWIEQPLFRCYLFVKVSYVEFFKVLSTPGIITYVSFGGKAQEIPGKQIENIKILIQQEEKEVIITKDHIARGVRAEVIFGKLKGLKGEVVKLCGQSRILIRIESLKCSLYAKISKDEVKIQTESEKTLPKKPLKQKLTRKQNNAKVATSYYRQQVIVHV